MRRSPESCERVKKLGMMLTTWMREFEFFDPNADTGRFARRPAGDRALRNDLRRFVLAQLRGATRPVTRREIADGIMAARGLATEVRRWL